MKKSYVITDPVYILPKEIWSACFDKCKNYENDSNWENLYNKEIENALKDFTQGQVFVESTGFGDWENQISGPNVKSSGRFTADSGMVCVCEYTGKVASALNKDNLVDNGCAAVFDATGPIKVDFDRHISDWTVVNIEDAEGDCWGTWIPDDEDEEE